MKNQKRKINGNKFLKWAVLGVMLTSTFTPAWAEEGKNNMAFTLEGVTVEAKRPDWETKLSPGTVTVIRPEKYKGEQKTLADLLKDVPGVHVREVNGKGQYTTVTIRGSTAAQVGVFIDGVMNNLGGDAAVDISVIPVKNVERVEVYRGYIPSRFGGTFIGGVINVVTKKPDKANISAEIGKSSFGGKSASLEVTSPAGSGSLITAINYEASDGDFPYYNYGVIRGLKNHKQLYEQEKSYIDNFNKNNINNMVKYHVLSLSDEEKTHYENNEEDWLKFIRGEEFPRAVEESTREFAKTEEGSSFMREMKELGYWDGFKRAYAESLGVEVDELSPDDFNDGLDDAWKDSKTADGYVTDEMKNKVIDAYTKREAPDTYRVYRDRADPERNTELAKKKVYVENSRKKVKASLDGRRHRRYNDRKNLDTMIKWQNQNWMVKGTWKRISRHLPDSLWGDGIESALSSALLDIEDIYYASNRKQTINSGELLVQNRREHGRLEWGWRLDYLRQKKKYNVGTKLEYPDNFRWKNIPLREWSRYNSNKYNFQIDGGYKLNDRQMLDFLLNYSKEKMKVDGSLMDAVMEGTIGSMVAQMRNRYEQDILNFQLQDSITLDAKGTLVLTPAIRFNQSKITGFSDSKRFKDESSGHFFWIHPKDSQTDGKWTWQLALKKEINDKLTLRMTGGTYFRLLNMYEIAGDGAGILPAPRRLNDKYSTVFPQPEYGKQFDFSMLWNGKTLGSDHRTTLTYFWRDSDRMLQLFKNGLDYWSYFNDNKGKAHGIELQSTLKWNKFSIAAEMTYTKTHMQRRNSTVGYDYTDVWATYQPEWEGTVRLTWTPNKKLSVYDEFHYTGEYFTYYGKSKEGPAASYLMGKPVPSLLTMNAGVKWKPVKHFQITLGCNDIFNKGPKLKIWNHVAFYDDGYVNPDYVIQGRTYFATVRYEF